MNRKTVPALGTDTSSVPSGAHSASRGRGVRAHTDSCHPVGTRTCRGWSNGACAMPGGTVTSTVLMPVCGTEVAPDDGAANVDEAGGAGSEAVLHPATSVAATSSAPRWLGRGETGMHLPDEDLGGVGGGDALATGCGEPHGVSFV